MKIPAYTCLTILKLLNFLHCRKEYKKTATHKGRFLSTKEFHHIPYQ